MPFEEVYLVNRHLRLVPAREIDALERDLGFPLPFGYREYLSTLGLGNLCRNFEVHRPSQIRSGLSYWRKEYVPIAVTEGFWDKRRFLTDEEMAQTVVFASNSEGDNFVACPSKGRVVIELPRHDCRMRLLRHGFLKPFNCPFGARKRYRFPFFEPDNGRRDYEQIKMKAGTKPGKIWKLAEERWGKGLRVVQRDPKTSETLKSFIPEIQGYIEVDASLDPPYFYFGYDKKYEDTMHDFVRGLAHMITWPDKWSARRGAK